MSDNARIALAKLKSSYLNDVFKMYSSSLFTMVIGLVGSFITARILGPTYQGFSKSVDLIQSYYPLSSFGVLNGMSRNVAMAHGKKDKEEASVIIDTTFTSLFSLPLLVSVVCFLLPIFMQFDSLTTLAFHITAVTSFLSLIGNINTRILFAELRFGVAAKIGVFSSLSGTIVGVLLVYLLNIEGRLWANLLSSAIALSISVYFVGHRFRFAINRKQLDSVVRIGLPIMLVGMTYTLLLGIDRWIILLFLSLADLGYYSIALTFSQLISGIIGSLSEITYQRLNRKFGETSNPRDLFSVATLPVQLLSLALPPVISLLILWLPILVHMLLPKFEPGIFAAQIYIFGTFVYGLSVNILNTVSRQKVYFTLQLVMIGINFVLGYLLVQHYGIVGVGIATTTSFCIYSLLLTFVSLRIMEQTFAEIVMFCMKLLLPITYSVAVIFLVSFFAPVVQQHGKVLMTIVESLISCGAYLPLWKPLSRVLGKFIAEKDGETI